MDSKQDGRPRTLFTMPRTYKRKTERKYTLETLKLAIREIKEKKISFRKAEEIYNIPRATLFDQIKKYQEENLADPKRGARPVFNESQEQELVTYILYSSRKFYGLTIPTLRKLAFDFAEANKLKHRFDKTTKMAGMDWYYCFMARHPEISLRKPEATSLHRILAFNKEETDIFFDNLTQLMLKYRFESNAIYNVDETGISTVQRNSKILAPRGTKQVGKCTSGERGSLTTVINACNAAGSYVPPFFIFKRKRMNPLLMKQSNSNMVASVSDSGWISEQLFIDWLHHFKTFARSAEDNIILLILANHESHISLAAYEFCKKNYIHVLTLPPHASHRMQPLDLTFHGPLKTAYNKECESFMVNKPGAKITTFDVVGLYTKAFNRTTNIEKAMNGFKAAGIYPLDKDRFKSTFESLADTTDPSTISDAPRSVASQKPNQSTLDLLTPVAQGVSITIVNRNLGDQSDTSCESLDGNGSPSLLMPSDLNETDIQTVKSNDLPSPVLEETAQPTIANLNASIPLSDIINMPSLQSPLKNKPRSLKPKHSIILTSTPEKEELEKKEKRKIERIKTKTGNIKKSIKKRKNTKTKSKKGVKNLKNFEDSANEEEYYCILCSEKYISPPTEDWIMCITCKKWAHENCTGPSTSGGYICDFCKD